MPVILPTDHYDQWLDPTLQQLEPLQALLRPYDADLMFTYPVSLSVNSPWNDVPGCITPIERMNDLTDY